MRLDSPMRKFDPSKVARYEKENYVAYYQKDWLKLMRVSVGLVQETFGLTLPQAIHGAYLVARGEMAFAPFPHNDVPKAEAYMRRFYALIKHIHREDFDVNEAARLEVNWWSVHRELFGNPNNQGLEDALRDIYAVAYGVDKARLQDAAHHRAMGMLYSDLWVNSGKRLDSPLLAQEEQELRAGYVALKTAIGTNGY